MMWGRVPKSRLLPHFKDSPFERISFLSSRIPTSIGQNLPSTKGGEALKIRKISIPYTSYGGTDAPITAEDVELTTKEFIEMLETLKVLTR